jgi:hypothetical protein
MVGRRALALTLLAVAGLAGSCNEVEEPGFVEVRVAYVSRLPVGCPDIGNICYAMCAHHNAPAGLQAIVPLWGAPTLRLAEAGPGRYEGVLSAVPTNTQLQLFGRDIGMCCVDACDYPPVLEDILLNGTKLTKVVREGLPVDVSAALEFTVDGRGAIR